MSYRVLLQALIYTNSTDGSFILQRNMLNFWKKTFSVWKRGGLEGTEMFSGVPVLIWTHMNSSWEVATTDIMCASAAAILACFPPLSPCNHEGDGVEDKRVINSFFQLEYAVAFLNTNKLTDRLTVIASTELHTRMKSLPMLQGFCQQVQRNLDSIDKHCAPFKKFCTLTFY